MTTRVLVIGGYGNFGSYIVHKLAGHKNLQVIIAGRSAEKCRTSAKNYTDSPNPPEYHAFDIHRDLNTALHTTHPHIVIHTSGPYQGQDYTVARACIEYGCNYIDLADSREFVAGISQLDAAARARGVCIISGASSVPALTAAIIDHYLPQYAKITDIDYGITTAQRTNTGLATTQAVLSYAGKPFQTLIKKRSSTIYGWQGLTAYRYPQLGWRLLGNCDVPDLTLFPHRYPHLETVRFRAGIEISFIHLALWMLSGLVRAGIIENLSRYAATLLSFSRYFDWLGSDRSAFHMVLRGTDMSGGNKHNTFHLVAQSGHGPFIPSMPAVLCALKIANGQITQTGAFPCVGIISLDEYLDALNDLDITVYR